MTGSLLAGNDGARRGRLGRPGVGLGVALLVPLARLLRLAVLAGARLVGRAGALLRQRLAQPPHGALGQ